MNKENTGNIANKTVFYMKQYAHSRRNYHN